MGPHDPGWPRGRVLRGHNVPLLAVATWRLHLAQELLSRYDRLVVVDAPETEDVGAA